MTNPQPILPVPAFDPVAAMARCADAIFVQDERTDAIGGFPHDSVALLADAGLLIAPFPVHMGGSALGSREDSIAVLRDVLTMLGNASQAVGRLYEGHVNAIILATRHGGEAILAELAAEARAGRLSGVWNAEPQAGLRLSRCDNGWQIDGQKIYCSGAGTIRRPVVTAAREAGAPPLMLVPDMTTPGVTVDLSAWRAAGMHGSMTGSVAFRAVVVPDDAVLGSEGTYYQAPAFAAGAWRVLAVQLGALQRVIKLHAAFLRRSGREREPVLRSRFADAAADAELARLLVVAAAAHAEDRSAAPADAENYVNMARTAFERLALGIIAATRRNVGLSSFVAPNPIDRVLRDLETYLRQPFLDVSRDSYALHLLAKEAC
ncbi:acyl-CoA dehydrogenase family protein [Polymorphobacter fuscus]|nr:acyl-CoA dehydrogenase family protein [Polymorphobacter fuscus]NJC08662.1 alkylation response protein AidB-like acyl-CoA dehydrogenase [Polymorphobacter fuscus]